ncbi:hypothetical protein [Duganella sp. Root1480D1]|uniref:hypothetical protein n=1 Tax=Duganella sp. Root1480D1 TaxID=1736471 RepID=UPI00070BAFD5|nr:hypothetical protein [Duganella sp. Root1480D1]KQZ26917.1 hypothetical protein ASD58_15120 [Duganella sp. Root1480D1]
MKVGLPALLLLLAFEAGAQSFISMGRLFTTPDERTQLDAQRNLAPTTASLAPAGGVPGAAPGTVGAAPAPAMDASTGCPPGAAPGCLPAGTPGAGGAAEAGGGSAGAAGMAGTPDVGEPEPPGLRLGGFIRRSNGPAMIIVNGEAQPAPPGGVMRGTVTLQADGRSVVLKPGQRYDPATGEVHEAAR